MANSFSDTSWENTRQLSAENMEPQRVDFSSCSGPRELHFGDKP